MRYYFASDMHLGLRDNQSDRNRERLLIRWLDDVSADATAIYLMGDVFDFWFEYRRLVPKGGVRLLGKLAELTDRGVEIHFFTGNHDMWVWDYFEKECGVIIHTSPQITTLAGKKILLAHGDGLGKSSILFRIMNGMFHSRCARSIFSALLHPNMAIKFGRCWSSSSRDSKNIVHTFREENEPIVAYSRQILASEDVDYFIYGHTHCALQYPLRDGSTAVFLGEWIANPTYAVLDEAGLKLHKYSYETVFGTSGED